MIGEAMRERLSARDLTREQFLGIVYDVLRATLPCHASVMVAGELALLVRGPDGVEGRICLRQAWDEVGSRPDAREALVLSRVCMIERMLQGGACCDDLARAQILPVVKDAAFVAEANAQLGPHDQLAARPLAADLFLVFAFDLPDQLIYVSSHHPEAYARVMREDALDELLGVLLEHLDEHFLIVDLGEALHGVRADGYAEAALLIHDALWDGLGEQLGFAGALVAATPRRGVLWFADSAREGALAMLRAMTLREHAQGPYAISPALLCRQEGRWCPFDA